MHEADKIRKLSPPLTEAGGCFISLMLKSVSCQHRGRRELLLTEILPSDQHWDEDKERIEDHLDYDRDRVEDHVRYDKDRVEDFVDGRDRWDRTEVVEVEDGRDRWDRTEVVEVEDVPYERREYVEDVPDDVAYLEGRREGEEERYDDNIQAAYDEGREDGRYDDDGF